MSTNVDELLSEAPVEEAQEFNEPEESNDALQEETHEEESSAEAEEEVKAESSEEDDLDDYGDVGDESDEPVYSKKKMQEIVQERLRRERARYEKMMEEARMSQAPQQPEAPADPYAQSADNQDWEAQLDTILEQRMQKIEQKKMQEAVRAREEQEQKEYAQKFEAGMSRYEDFGDVVDPFSMSDHMMMATRGLKNPAAFIYSANKHHAEDLSKIKQLPPAQQMVEIGRLEERMRRQRSTQSKAPAPIMPDKGDVRHKSFTPSNSVDQLLMREQSDRIKRRQGK